MYLFFTFTLLLFPSISAVSFPLSRPSNVLATLSICRSILIADCEVPAELTRNDSLPLLWQYNVCEIEHITPSSGNHVRYVCGIWACWQSKSCLINFHNCKSHSQWYKFWILRVVSKRYTLKIENKIPQKRFSQAGTNLRHIPINSSRAIRNTTTENISTLNHFRIHPIISKFIWSFCHSPYRNTTG